MGFSFETLLNLQSLAPAGGNSSVSVDCSVCSCSLCHENAACIRLSNISISSCLCKEGYLGNGYICNVVQPLEAGMNGKLFVLQTSSCEERLTLPKLEPPFAIHVAVTHVVLRHSLVICYSFILCQYL
jgi:hypothetical protein